MTFQIDYQIIAFIVSILSIGAAINVALTEAIKKAFQNAGKPYSSNLIALINAFVVGGIGTAVLYVLGDVQWNVQSITILFCMIPLNWIGATLGWDKFIQLLAQLGKK